jgi:hypothetical protein
VLAIGGHFDRSFAEPGDDSTFKVDGDRPVRRRGRHLRSRLERHSIALRADYKYLGISFQWAAVRGAQKTPLSIVTHRGEWPHTRRRGSASVAAGARGTIDVPRPRGPEQQHSGGTIEGFGLR